MIKTNQIYAENQALNTKILKLSKTSQSIADEIIRLKRKNSSFTPFTQDQLAIKFKVTREHINRCINLISLTGLFTHYQPKKHHTQKWRRARYIMNPLLQDESVRMQLAPILPSLHFYSLSRLMLYEPRLKKSQEYGNITRINLKERSDINNLLSLDVIHGGVVHPDGRIMVGCQEDFLQKRIKMELGEKQLRELREFSADVIQEATKRMKGKELRNPQAYLLIICRSIIAERNSPQKGRTQLSPAARAMYPRQGQSVEPPKRETTFKRTAVEEEAMARLEKRRKEMYSKPNSWQDKAREELAAYKAAGMSDLDIFKRRISEAQERQRQKSLSHGMHEDFDNWHAQFPIPAIIEEQDGLREEYTGQASGVVFRRRMDKD